MSNLGKSNVTIAISAMGLLYVQVVTPSVGLITVTKCTNSSIFSFRLAYQWQIKLTNMRTSFIGHYKRSVNLLKRYIDTNAAVAQVRFNGIHVDTT